MLLVRALFFADGELVSDPSYCSAFSDFWFKRDFYNRRNAVGEKL
jgi:hypothetical protein